MGIAGRVTTTIFQTVLNRLGIRNPDVNFALADIIQPVSIVDSDIGFVVGSPVRGAPASAGFLVAPAINTVLADSGPMPAGNYDLLVLVDSGSTGTEGYEVQRRDAANAANVWGQRVINTTVAGTAGPTKTWYYRERVSLAVNERVRVIILAAGTAGSWYQANVWITSA